MKKVEIENRTKEGTKRDFFMVDLIIEDEKIDTGENPIESHSFWTDIQDQSQRALYRIEKENPTMKFDFNLATMAMSEEQKDERFKSHIKGKYPNIDIDRLFEVIDNEIKEIQVTGPDDNHPNPFLKIPISSHMTKNIITSVIDKFLKEKE